MDFFDFIDKLKKNLIMTGEGGGKYDLSRIAKPMQKYLPPPIMIRLDFCQSQKKHNL